MSASRLDLWALVLLPATTLAAIGLLQDPASAGFDQPSWATGQVSVMFRDGTLDWPQGVGSSGLDSLTFADSHLDSLLHAGGVATVEKLFKGFAPDDTLRIARDGLLVRVLDLSQIYVLHTSGGDFSDAFIRDLAAARGVLFAERIPAATLPFSWRDPPADDPKLLDDQQWGLFNLGSQPGYVPHADIDVKRAWQIQTGRPGVRLGVIDTGVCLDHPDLSPAPFQYCYEKPGCKVVGGHNAIWDLEDPYDWCDWEGISGHGTAVAAVAAGLTNNVNTGFIPWDGGVAGVAGGYYAGVPGDSMGVSLLAYTGVGPFAVTLVAESTDSATVDGAHITNHSYGFQGDASSWTPLWYVMINAFNQGIVQVASMGEASAAADPLTPYFPASAEQGVLAVGATSFNDHRVSPWEVFGWQSNYGPHLDVVAPGIAHFSATPLQTPCGGPPYVAEFFEGTSCGAPMVSGIAALLLSEDPSLSNEEVAGIICASAKDLVYQDPTNQTYAYPGWDEETGWGRVDAFQALMRLRSPYRRQVKSELGYDVREETGITYFFGPPLDRDRLVQSRVTKEVPIEFGWFTGTPDVWGLSRMSSGACSLLTGPGDGGLVAAEFAMGCCKVVKGSETGSTCTLKSFVYKWSHNYGGGWVDRGWLPNDPECHCWRYEVLGNVLDPEASIVEAAPLTDAADGVPCVCPAGDCDGLAFKLRLLDNVAAALAGVPSTDTCVRVASGEQTPHPVGFRCLADAETASVYWPEEFEESDENGDLSLVLPPMGGHDPQALWTVHVSGLAIDGALEQGVRSVDVDSDGDVDLQDLTLFVAAHGSGAWLADLDGDGICNLSDTLIFCAHYGHGCAAGGRTGSGEGDLAGAGTAVEWAVSPSSPNPFAGTTQVTFRVPAAAQRVRVAVYDIRGRLTRTLCDSEYDAGTHSVTWDGRDSRGERAASGVYFFEVTAPGFRDRGKMMLLR